MMKKLIVKREFADKKDISKRYKVGDELIGFSKNRINDILERGLAEYKEDDIKNDINIETIMNIDLSLHWSQIIQQVKVCKDFEQLNDCLKTEQSSESPRKSVIQAIEKRIEELTVDN
jgi:hypothetical protein